MTKDAIRLLLFAVAAALPALCPSAAQAAQASENAAPRPHNIIIFVTDGLRHDSVTPETAPTIYSLRQKGVDFVNSHALYPTFTTPNASAFATGHLLGDTGDFGNALYFRSPVPNRDNTAASLTPFIENDLVLARLNELFNGNYLNEQTLMDLARANGYAVAAVGKLGPVGIQNAAELKASGGVFQETQGVIVDDSTGPQGVPLPKSLARFMKDTDMPSAAPDRNNGQPATSRRSNGRSKGTMAANYMQQQYFADMATMVVLPEFAKEHKPFFLLYWSRDPDGSQHNQADNPGELKPGINGPTSRAGIRNADNNLSQIIDYLKREKLYADTDIIVVADHGFSTISKTEIDGAHTHTASYAAGKSYVDVAAGHLPPGFLAIDLAHALHKPLYGSDEDVYTVQEGNQSVQYYQRLDCGCGDEKMLRHPVNGSALVGGTGKVPRKGTFSDADFLVAANGGSDLIYFPDDSDGKLKSNRAMAGQIVDILLQQDYVDGIFIDDELGDLPGTLPLKFIGLNGKSPLPRPAIVVSFRNFALDDTDPLLTRVEISDSELRQGQGMHGSFSRADTYNNMAAFGPDFKKGYKDDAPVSNADLVVTIASIMKWQMRTDHGTLLGRVVREALAGGPDKVTFEKPSPKVSTHAGPNGVKTILHYQVMRQDGEEHRYFDQACMMKISGDKTPQCR